MSFAFPALRVGEPVCHEAIAVFPLFAEPHSQVNYHLSDAALADGLLSVEEVDESGSVPDLLVENKGDVRVLFLEGEELVGAKQDRVLNTSILVAAHSKIKIPVSCVEQGRWGYKSRYFESSGSHVPSKLRRALKESVSRSLKAKQGYKSDQGEVWKEVAGLHATHDVQSGTEAMSDAFDTYKDRIASYQDRLKYVAGAVGMAVAIGDQVVSADLFDKSSTCEKVWDRMLSGVVFDAMEVGETNKHASVADVEQFIATVGDLQWEEAKAVGEGQEHRAESDRGDHASALTFDQTVVHGSVMGTK